MNILRLKSRAKTPVCCPGGCDKTIDLPILLTNIQLSGPTPFTIGALTWQGGFSLKPIFYVLAVFYVSTICYSKYTFFQFFYLFIRRIDSNIDLNWSASETKKSDNSDPSQVIIINLQIIICMITVQIYFVAREGMTEAVFLLQQQQQWGNRGYLRISYVGEDKKTKRKSKQTKINLMNPIIKIIHESYT